MTEDWEGGSLEESGKLDDPRYRCKHGVYVGDPYGPDYMCPACELGLDEEDEIVKETWHISAIFKGRSAPDTMTVKACGIEEAYNDALNIWDVHENDLESIQISREDWVNLRKPSCGQNVPKEQLWL